MWHLALSFWNRTRITAEVVAAVIGRNDLEVRCALLTAAHADGTQRSLPASFASSVLDYVRNWELVPSEVPLASGLTRHDSHLTAEQVRSNPALFEGCLHVDCLMIAPIWLRDLAQVPAFRVVDRSVDKPTYFPVLWVSLGESTPGYLRTSVKLCPCLAVAESPIGPRVGGEAAKRNLQLLKDYADTVAAKLPNREGASTLELEAVPMARDDELRFSEVFPVPHGGRKSPAGGSGE